MLELETAAMGFAAVGSQPRLEVLLALVRAGGKGLTVGEIQERVGQPPSTLAHHLRHLADGSLIEQVREGRSVINLAAYERIKELAAYLLKECCLDAEHSGIPHSAVSG